MNFFNIVTLHREDKDKIDLGKQRSISTGYFQLSFDFSKNYEKYHQHLKKIT